MAMLLADTGLAAQVGTRIHWQIAAQNTAKPYVVLTRISSSDAITYRDVAVITESRVQVDCYALTYLGAKQVARAVKAALNGKGGGLAATIDRVFYDTERDLFEEAATPDKLHRVSADYRVWHR